MELNEEIFEVLKEFKINKNKGILALLAIYFKLDAETTIDEETIKAINLTKIVNKDHANGMITWNMPLFAGQQTEWDWVKDKYNKLWDRNRDRKASNPDCIKRMQEWFKKYPAYRLQDVEKATLAYHTATRDPQYLKNSAAFIFDGVGASKKSILLAWCEKTKDAASTSNMKGTIAI
jgi:hypothetical protein